MPPRPTSSLTHSGRSQPFFSPTSEPQSHLQPTSSLSPHHPSQSFGGDPKYIAFWKRRDCRHSKGRGLSGIGGERRMGTEDFEGSETIPWDATAVDARHCTLFGLTERRPPRASPDANCGLRGTVRRCCSFAICNECTPLVGAVGNGGGCPLGVEQREYGKSPSSLLFAVIKHQARVF